LRSVALELNVPFHDLRLVGLELDVPFGNLRSVELELDVPFADLRSVKLELNVTFSDLRSVVIFLKLPSIFWLLNFTKSCKVLLLTLNYKLKHAQQRKIQNTFQLATTNEKSLTTHKI